MFKIINFFKARPSDHTIKMLRILIGLWLSALLGLGCMTYEILPGLLSDTTELIVKYVLIVIALLPALWWIWDVPLAKRRVVSYGMSVFWLFWLIVGNMIDPVAHEAKPIMSLSNTGVSYTMIAETNKDVSGAYVDVGFWVALIGFIILLAGWTGKFVTHRHIKHGETITKIRI